MTSPFLTQTYTPVAFAAHPAKQDLVHAFRGKPLEALRTPAAIIDRAIFAKNCAQMHDNARAWGAGFRAHVKTHKTSEGTRLQLASNSDQTHAIVVSTVMEAWEIANAGLVADGTVLDILYGLPLPPNKLADLSDLWDKVAPQGGIIRVLIDHPDQVAFLEKFETDRTRPRRWSVFIKVDAGGRRAGLDPSTSEYRSLISRVIASTSISLYGFYCHAGQSYSSTSLSAASAFLSEEISAVNSAAEIALSLIGEDQTQREESFILSVGSTPTAHAATPENRTKLNSLLHGTLELHAGNYTLLDLQQLHTGLIDRSRIAQRVLSTVISYYPERGEDGVDEALCDAGAIALSKDTGPSGSYGEVIGTTWKLGRISQEHGILVQTQKADSDSGKLRVGDVIEIVGQHACLTLAAHPWYYVVDSESESAGRLVEDVWVPWKGW